MYNFAFFDKDEYKFNNFELFSTWINNQDNNKNYVTKYGIAELQEFYPDKWTKLLNAFLCSSSW